MSIRTTMVLGATLLLAGCASTTAPVDATGTLFEIEYVNFAWVPTWRGVVIDTAGVVHGFDLDGEQWKSADATWVSAAELESKWAKNSEERGTVPRTTLAEMAARVPAAAAGQLSSPVNRCADAGTITYSAYRWDAARGAFRRVVLLREGDVAQANDAGAARAIAEWLVSLELTPRFERCGA